jgi:hypothetical protein
MRTKIIVRAFVMISAITLIFVLSAGATDISGKWTAPATSPSGSPMGDRIFTFKAEGNKLTGTVITQQTVNATFEVAGQPKMVGKLTTQSGNPTEISDGKISGNEISFVTVMTMGPMEMKTTYKGTVSGSEIKFTSEMPMPSGMPMMGQTSSQGASSSAQGAQGTSQGASQTRTTEFVAKRMNQ